MSEQPLLPFTVTARRSRDSKSVRIGILAHTRSDAIQCAREIFPQHLIFAAVIHPKWGDEPA